MFEIFGVPICKDKINLDLINIKSERTSSTFMSELQTSRLEKVNVHESTKNYLLNIFYNNVETSNTVFVRPSSYIAECTKWTDWFSNELQVNCVKGDIVIFPSFLEHMVTKVEKHGSTIAGNIRMFRNE